MEEKQMLPEEREVGGNKAGKVDKTLLELSLGIFFWGDCLSGGRSLAGER